MDVDRRHAADKSSLDVLVGVQTGVIGGLVMLAWFTLITPLTGRAWWLVPNLLASGIYFRSPAVYSPGIATLAGIAVLLLAGGIVGIVNALVTPGGRLFGLALAASCYLLSYMFIWKRFAPMMLTYASQPIVIIGFFLFGSVLGWHHYLLARARGLH